MRALDPVAAAEVEGTPLRPPAFGAPARAALRAALEPAEREAAGIDADLLSPELAMVLRVSSHALARGRSQLEHPPWRDDPGALVDAVEPYASALWRRAAARQCDDGCGLDQLGPALEAGLAEVGAASPAAAAAARDDLAALRRALPSLATGLPADHPLAAAVPGLDAALGRVDAALAPAIAALPAAAERPWAEPVPPAVPSAWLRRPARWPATRLRRALEDREAWGRPPAATFELAERTAARLWAMQRAAPAEAAAPGPAPARPFDAAACEAAWAPLRAWAQAQQAALELALDCAAVARRAEGPIDDAALVRLVVTAGVVEPTTRARVAATGKDVALVQGRAAPLAQGLTLEIAIEAGSGRTAAMTHALRDAHHRACLAAAAVWVHGELGDAQALGARLAPHGCGDVATLWADAEARPLAALQGLGLALVGDGPADAAALDRFGFAPMGLVHDLALPPPPPADLGPTVRVEALGADDPASPPVVAPDAP